MSRSPDPSATMADDAAFRQRVGVYAGGGQLERDLAVIWARASTSIVEAAEASAESAMAAMGDKTQPIDWKRAAHDALIKLFNRPVDEDWMDDASGSSHQGDRQATMPMIAQGLGNLIAGVNLRIMTDFGDDPAFVRLATSCMTRLLAFKLELVTRRVNVAAVDQERNLRIAEGEVFRGTVGELLHQALSGSKDLRSRTAGASGAARGMLGKASEVAAAAEQSAVAMREAAQTSAGLIRAIEDARNEVEVATGVATRAGAESDRAVEISQVLSDHARTIESILGLIRDIAGQTNLLALNATIEAARAGDAGRGFAVVAQEVKSLANQTARATDEIAAKIGAIQVATRQTVDANGSIRTTISDVRASAERIRMAMETQAQTVTMITAAVDETALAADAMSGTIAAIRTDTERLAGNIDELDTGFRDVDGRLGALETSALDFVARIG